MAQVLDPTNPRSASRGGRQIAVEDGENPARKRYFISIRGLITHNPVANESPSRLEGIPTVERPKRKRHLLGRTVGAHIPGAKNVLPRYSKPRVKGGALGVHKPNG